MATRTPVQIAKEIESIQALVAAGSLSDAAGRAAIEQLTRELLAAAASPTFRVVTAAEVDHPAVTASPGDAQHGESARERFAAVVARLPAEPAPEPPSPSMLAILQWLRWRPRIRPRDHNPVGGRSRFTMGQIFVASLLGTPIAGAVLGAVNALRDGQRFTALVRGVGGPIVFLLASVCSLALSAHPWIAFGWTTAACAGLFLAFAGRGGAGRSTWLGVVGAVATGWLVVGAVSAVGLWSFLSAFEASKKAIAAGDALTAEDCSAAWGRVQGRDPRFSLPRAHWSPSWFDARFTAQFPLLADPEVASRLRRALDTDDPLRVNEAALYVSPRFFSECADYGALAELSRTDVPHADASAGRAAVERRLRFLNSVGFRSSDEPLVAFFQAIEGCNVPLHSSRKTCAALLSDHDDSAVDFADASTCWHLASAGEELGYSTADFQAFLCAQPEFFDARRVRALSTAAAAGVTRAAALRYVEASVGLGDER